MGAGGVALGLIVGFSLDQQIKTIFGDEHEIGAFFVGESADLLHELAQLLAIIEDDAALDRWRGLLLFSGL